MERRYGEGHEGQPQPLVVEQPPVSFAEAGSFTIFVIVAGIFRLTISILLNVNVRFVFFNVNFVKELFGIDKSKPKPGIF